MRIGLLLFLVFTALVRGQVDLEFVVRQSGTVAIANMGDNRLFFVRQSGQIRIYDGAQVLATPFLDIESIVLPNGENGLLSMAFHPDYAVNGFFFINYSDLSGDTVIARYQVSAGDPNLADPASARTLMTIFQPEPNHNGGQIQFGPDGYLYIGMGDGGGQNDPGCHAQNPGDPLGKMLRIDVDQNINTPPFHGIPVDNPFVGDPSTLDEIWAIGLRNPWRFSFDRFTGDLYIADVGQGQWEEVNYQPADSLGGENYGWDVMEGLHCHQDDPSCPAGTAPCMDDSFTDPVAEYSHAFGCSVTGGYLYRGCLAPELHGKYIYADFCSGRIWATWQSAPGVWSTEELAVVAGARTFGEDADGELYVERNFGDIMRFTGSEPGYYYSIWNTDSGTPCFPNPVTILELVNSL